MSSARRPRVPRPCRRPTSTPRASPPTPARARPTRVRHQRVRHRTHARLRCAHRARRATRSLEFDAFADDDVDDSHAPSRRPSQRRHRRTRARASIKHALVHRLRRRVTRSTTVRRRMPHGITITIECAAAPRNTTIVHFNAPTPQFATTSRDASPGDECIARARVRVDASRRRRDVARMCVGHCRQMPFDQS